MTALTVDEAAPLMPIWERRIAEQLVAQLQRPDCVGFKARIRLVPGDHTATQVKGMLLRISSAFQVGGTHVEVIPDEADQSIATLIVAFPDGDKKHPLERRFLWTHPTFDPATGFFLHGRAIDYSPVMLRAWHPQEGGKLFWFTGATNGGKSTSLDGTLLELCSSGMVVPFIADMKGGASLADWRDHVPVYINGVPDDEQSGIELKAMLKGFRAMTAWRALYLGQLKNADGSAAKVLPYGLRDPVPMLVLEEVPDYWPLVGEEGVRDVEYLARNVRALFEILALASQDTTVGWRATGALGGSNTLRKQIKNNGNVILHKNDPDSGEQAGGAALEEIDPSLIPAISGVNYAVAPFLQAPQMNRRLYPPNVHQSIQRYVTIPDMAAAGMSDLSRGSIKAYWDGVEKFITEVRAKDRARAANSTPSGQQKSGNLAAAEKLAEWLADPGRYRSGASRGDCIDYVRTLPGCSEYSSHSVDRILKNGINPDEDERKGYPRLSKLAHGNYAVPGPRPVGTGTDRQEVAG